MATTVSARPMPQAQKVKRPPSAAQSSPNSVEQQSSSPSISSKRPPPGFKHPSTASVSHALQNGTGNASRLNSRRRDSQKPSEDSKAQAKGLKLSGIDAINMDKKSRGISEPYVKTTSYILRKFSKASPSFILHLHPTHFRFDEQDGSFSYTSPMRVLLEHIKAQTVPHEMLSELVAAGIKFYDNCLIVQVQDHRSSSRNTQAPSSSSSKEQPYSIHNYNKFITPSPFVAFPTTGLSGTNSDSATVSSTNHAGETPKTPMDGPNRVESAAGHTPQPRVFTTVLFQTAFSLQEELSWIANTPDTRATSRKQSQNGAKGPASVNIPQTPLSGVFSASLQGPPQKKQKLLYNAKDIVEIESKIVAAAAPPLFLDPVDNLEEAQVLLQKLQDPLATGTPPAPKSRKRTVAELAADEALAAEEQRFMLIMDERLVPNHTASTANKAAGATGEASSGTFEARFERFKAIDEIRNVQQEKKQREQEAKIAFQQQQQKLKLEQQERENAATAAQAAAARQQAVAAAAQEQKARDGMNARRQEALQQMQNRQLHGPSQQLLQQQGSGQHAHPPSSSSMISNQQQLAASQAHHSSPIVRNMTPHNASSPIVGAGGIGQVSQSIPMSASTSNQGAGSPPRPTSAMQQSQHQAAVMAAQRSQQPPSRNGTPAMPNGTPRIQQSTPVMRNVTPTPRMNHASPVNQPAGTPAMNHFGHINGSHLTPQQQQQLMYQRQQAIQNQQMQGSPPGGQMPGPNMQFAAQQFPVQRASEANYRQSLQNLTQQQMSNAQMSHQGYPNGMPMNHMRMQQNVPHQPSLPNKWVNMYNTALQQFQHRFRDQAIAQYGPNLPAVIIQQIRVQADNKARTLVTTKRQAESRLHQEQMMAHQMQQGGNMGNMNSM